MYAQHNITSILSACWVRTYALLQCWMIIVAMLYWYLNNVVVILKGKLWNPYPSYSVDTILHFQPWYNKLQQCCRHIGKENMDTISHLLFWYNIEFSTMIQYSKKNDVVILKKNIWTPYPNYSIDTLLHFQPWYNILFFIIHTMLYLVTSIQYCWYSIGPIFDNQ